MNDKITELQNRIINKEIEIECIDMRKEAGKYQVARMELETLKAAYEKEIPVTKGSFPSLQEQLVRKEKGLSLMDKESHPELYHEVESQIRVLKIIIAFEKGHK